MFIVEGVHSVVAELPSGGETNLVSAHHDTSSTWDAISRNSIKRGQSRGPLSTEKLQVKVLFFNETFSGLPALKLEIKPAGSF